MLFLVLLAKIGVGGLLCFRSLDCLDKYTDKHNFSISREIYKKHKCLCQSLGDNMEYFCYLIH